MRADLRAGLGFVALAGAHAVKAKTVPIVYAVPLIDRENHAFHTLAGITFFTPSRESLGPSGEVTLPLHLGSVRFVDDATGRLLHPAPVNVIKRGAAIASEIARTAESGFPVSVIAGFALRLPELVDEGFELEAVASADTPETFVRAVEEHARPSSVTVRLTRDTATRVISVRVVEDTLVEMELTPV